MPKKYEVLMSTTYVVKSSMTDRYSTGDVREIVKEAPVGDYKNHLPRLMEEMEDEH